MAETRPPFPVVKYAYEPQRITFGEQTSVEIPLVVTWASSEIDVAQAVLLFLTPYFSGLALSQVSVDDREGTHCWRASATYSSTRSAPISSVQGSIEDPEVSYQLGGETKHITQSLGVRVYRAAGLWSLGDSIARVIGAKKDGVEGADILTPVVTFSETHYFLRKNLTRSLRTTWENMFAKTNSVPFRGYDAGEVLFEGAQVTIRGAGDTAVPVAFSFRRRQNKTNVVFGAVTAASIEGWELVDMRYKDEKDTDTKRTEKKPDRVHIHKVYDSGDFGALGISTT